MAAIRERGSYQWQAQVIRKGFPSQYKTFNNKSDAGKWARLIESEMDQGAFFSRKKAENTTHSEALDPYLTEITEKKKAPTRNPGESKTLKSTVFENDLWRQSKEEALQSIVTNGSQPSHQRLSEENLSSFRISSPLLARNGACRVLEIPSRPSGYLPLEEFPGIAA